MADPFEDDISTYPQGLVLVPRTDDNSVIVGPHIRGSRLRASSATGDEEVDLLLPGTARYYFFFPKKSSFSFLMSTPYSCNYWNLAVSENSC